MSHDFLFFSFSYIKSLTVSVNHFCLLPFRKHCPASSIGQINEIADWDNNVHTFFNCSTKKTPKTMTSFNSVFNSFRMAAIVCTL